MIIEKVLSPDTTALIRAYMEAKINLCQCENGVVSAPKSFILRQDAITLAVGKSFRDSKYPEFGVNGQSSELLLLQKNDKIVFSSGSGETHCLLFVGGESEKNLIVNEDEIVHSLSSGDVLIADKNCSLNLHDLDWCLILSFCLQG